MCLRHYTQPEMFNERVEVPVVIQQFITAFDASCGY